MQRAWSELEEDQAYAGHITSTPCLKKLCKIIFVRTCSNFHQFWQFLAEIWQRG